MHVYMDVCVYVCTYMNTYINKHMRTRARAHTQYVWMKISIHTQRTNTQRARARA